MFVHGATELVLLYIIKPAKRSLCLSYCGTPHKLLTPLAHIASSVAWCLVIDRPIATFFFILKVWKVKAQKYGLHTD